MFGGASKGGIKVAGGLDGGEDGRGCGVFAGGAWGDRHEFIECEDLGGGLSGSFGELVGRVKENKLGVCNTASLGIGLALSSRIDIDGRI